MSVVGTVCVSGGYGICIVSVVGTIYVSGGYGICIVCISGGYGICIVCVTGGFGICIVCVNGVYGVCIVSDAPSTQRTAKGTRVTALEAARRIHIKVVVGDDAELNNVSLSG